MTEKNVLIVFDFDGVIVDSIDFLKRTYLEFLEQFGFSGSQEEFNFLNGPTLEENIKFLKNKYELIKSEKELIENYKDLLRTFYDDVILFKGVKEILTWLKANNFKIALASSCYKYEIKKVFNKFHLDDFFDFIVTGDLVKKSKPNPEIYNIVKKRFPNSTTFVIEDSENGIEAALAAGLKTIQFTNSTNKTSKKVFGSVNTHFQLKQFIFNILPQNFTLNNFNGVLMNYSKHSFEFSNSLLTKINNIWERNVKRKGLKNGNIFCYKSHEILNGKLILDCYTIEYKYFFAQLFDSKIDLNIRPICVSGIIIDSENNSLIGRRKNVTEYENFYELLPSGGIEFNKISGDSILYEDQLIEEFEEETKLKRIEINRIEHFFLFFDHLNQVYDLCSKIFLNSSLKEKLKVKDNDEYDNVKIFSIINPEVELDNSNCVPTSLAILTSMNI